MKKNGFTLVELLAVIMLLGILATIGVTSAINMSKKIKDDMFCQKIDFIFSAAKMYGNDRLDSLTETGVNITVKDLVDYGYLKKDQDVSGHYVINPKDDSALDKAEVYVYLKNHRATAEMTGKIRDEERTLDTSFCKKRVCKESDGVFYDSEGNITYDEEEYKRSCNK